MVIVPVPIKPRVGRVTPETGKGCSGVGVGAFAIVHVQELDSVQLGLRQDPPAQVIVLGQSLLVIQVEPQDGAGVGVGVTVGPHWQVSTAVHPARRH